jgi:hypothetical protein
MHRSTSVSAVCAVAVSTCASAEVIGPYDIVAAPISASLIAGGGPDWGWLNFEDVTVTVDTAFTGFSVIADGYGSADAGTIVELTLSAHGIPNEPGPDLVLFEARYGKGEYVISTEPDFSVEIELLESDFNDTGEDRVYFFEFNPLPIPTIADVWAAEIDLTDLGFGDGELVRTLYFRTTNDQADPLGVGILVPAPVSILAVGLGAPTLLGARRRRRQW